MVKIPGMTNLVRLVTISGLVLVLNSCKKENKFIVGFLQGKWELQRISGMLTTTYPPGNGNTIEFTGNQYVLVSNGQVTRQGQFEIIRDNSAPSSTCLNISSDQFPDRIIFDNDMTSQKIFLRVSNRSLTFISGCFAIDAGFTKDYRKL
jgi:hypothetical protein